jgi:hypothetical protein
MPQISEVVIGDKVSFQSKAVNDNNNYFGEVIGEVTSVVAQTYSDIFTYNFSVQSADANVPEPTLQSYLLIKLLEPLDNTDRYIIPFSKDWIRTETLTIHATNSAALIKVYEVNQSNIQDVLNLLISNGFKARLDTLV